MSVPSLRGGPVFGRRACAVLALSSAGLHAAMLGHASNVVAGLLLAAMIAVHLPAPSHHHGMHAATAGQQSTLMGLATAVAAVEVAVAMAVLYYRTRGNAQLVSGEPAR